MLRKSSIGSELFGKVQLLAEISKIYKNLEILRNFVEGGTPALRSIRAGTRLTVHRSLPYWCVGKPRPKGTATFCNVGLFEHVSRQHNHVDVKMCNMESLLHLLKFDFR